MSKKLLTNSNQKRNVIVYLRFLTSKKNLFVPENNLDTNTWYSINHDDLEKYFKMLLFHHYYFVLLDSEIKFDTNPIVFLRNNHLNYSITWFLLSLSSIVMLLIIRRKNE